MKVANTIQISSEEDRQINRLQKSLGLDSKKAVIRQGLKMLDDMVAEQQRYQSLQRASQRISQQSKKANQEWSPYSTALKVK